MVIFANIYTLLYKYGSLKSSLVGRVSVTSPQLWVVWTSSKFDVLLLLHLRTRTMLVPKFCKIFLWSMSNPVFVISKLHSWYNSHFKVFTSRKLSIPETAQVATTCYIPCTIVIDKPRFCSRLCILTVTCPWIKWIRVFPAITTCN